MAHIPKDEYGPHYVIEVHDASVGMDGVLVIDNLALGQGKGGIRMTHDVTAEEVFRLARTMTWKNSIAGIPFGGAKAGLRIPQGTTPKQKQAIVESFARHIKPFVPNWYIGGPDVNSGEREMQWIAEATKEWNAVTGKPAKFCAGSGTNKRCGLPHELGSTGFGVAHAARVAAEEAGIPLKGATVAIHGFGNVGTFAYTFLTEMGAKVVAIANRDGAVVNKEGFDDEKVKKVIAGKADLLKTFAKSTVSANDFWATPVDILIPASVTDVINESNKKFIKAKLIVEGGNIAMSDAIELEYWKKGIVIVPDFVANAGGVISSYAEYKGYSPEKMFTLVKSKITDATRTVVRKALKTGTDPRTVALAIAKERVRAAMKKRKLV